VWGDSTDAAVASTAANQFMVRASGGISLTVGDGGWRVEPNATSPNLIGGYGGNSVAAGVSGGTVGGGGASIGLNAVTANYGTVAGGIRNTVRAPYGTVSGGVENLADNTSTVGGGWDNQVARSWSTIGGGAHNRIDAESATVAGGWGNNVSGSTATIGGGSTNRADGQYDTVSGGFDNVASGSYAAVGGGSGNAATDAATVAGGVGNSAANFYTAVGGGQTNTASGYGATISGGTNNIASGPSSSIPGGSDAAATLRGQVAYASGKFAAAGDAQAATYILRLLTTDSATHPMALDGNSENLIIAPGQTLSFDILVVARSDAAASAGYRAQGVIENNTGTTGFIGTPTVTVLGEDVSAWNVTVQADNSIDALVIRVTGAAGVTIRWVATVRTAEVAW
jgi:hypothetical protein